MKRLLFAVLLLIGVVSVLGESPQGAFAADGPQFVVIFWDTKTGSWIGLSKHPNMADANETLNRVRKDGTIAQVVPADADGNWVAPAAPGPDRNPSNKSDPKKTLPEKKKLETVKPTWIDPLPTPNPKPADSLAGRWTADCGSFIFTRGAVTHFCRGNMLAGKYRLTADTITITFDNGTRISGGLKDGTIDGTMVNPKSGFSKKITISNK